MKVVETVRRGTSLLTTPRGDDLRALNMTPVALDAVMDALVVPREERDGGGMAGKGKRRSHSGRFCLLTAIEASSL